MLPFALPCWGMLGLLAGLWKLAIGAAALGFYLWRKGLLRHPLFKLLVPWTATPPTSARARPTPWTAATTGRSPAAPPSPGPDRLAAPAGSPAAPRRPVPAAIPLAGLARLVQDRWSLLLLILGFLTLLAWVVARWTTHHAPSGPLAG